MVTGPPIRDDGWLEFDNLSFMNVEDDSEDKAAAEKRKFVQSTRLITCEPIFMVTARSQSIGSSQ